MEPLPQSARCSSPAPGEVVLHRQENAPSKICSIVDSITKLSTWLCSFSPDFAESGEQAKLHICFLSQAGGKAPGEDVSSNSSEQRVQVDEAEDEYGHEVDTTSNAVRAHALATHIDVNPVLERWA